MSPQAGFVLQEEIVPRLRSAVPKSVLCVGSEDHQELVSDAITMAAKMLDRVAASLRTFRPSVTVTVQRHAGNTKLPTT